MSRLAKEWQVDRQDRQSKIVDLVIERGSVHVDDIVAALGVSPATVRRDLDALSEQQLITRVRGGAKANASSGELPMRYRTSREWDEKQAIARRACLLAKPGSVVSFNGGTTTTVAAYELGVRTSSERAFTERPLTVITNAVNIANDLTVRPNVQLVVIGGVARSRSYELVGSLAKAVLERIKVGLLFLGVTSLDIQSGGIYTNNEAEAVVNTALVEVAQKVVVLADHTKFGQSAFANICSFDKIDQVITDGGTSADQIAALTRHGIEVTVA
nr:DeoR/GlpR family DNA-binding transcription regulator [Winkia sp. ACRQY]